MLLTLPDNIKVVVKRGANSKHIENEYDMNRYLNQLGIGVPESILETHTGRSVMISNYEEEARQPSLSNTRDMVELRQGFVVQALIANWDVIGIRLDNVLIRPDGSATYVDLGGSGRYMGRGSLKIFQTFVKELKWMQCCIDNSVVYEGMSDRELVASFVSCGGADAMEGALSVIQNEKTITVLRRRIGDITRQIGKLK